MKRLGLAGFGFIGRFLYDRLADSEDIKVAAVWNRNPEKLSGLEPDIICPRLEELGARELDLVVEAAHPEVVRALWPHLTSGADLMIASMTGLADRDFRRRMQVEAQERKIKVFLPHGAVLGLDGLRDGRDLLESVSITTTKHPRNLGLPQDTGTEPRILFDGPTREACLRFPRNVNVHAAIALAGMGFEATRSKIVADPSIDKMRHRIEVRGRGLSWNLEIESFSAGQVTGSYTPESLYQSIRGVLLETYDYRIV